MQVPPKIAAPLLLTALLLTALVDTFAPPTLWLGPVYLVVIGSAAWMLGQRHAMMLGLLVVATNLMTGNAGVFPNGPDSAVLNFSIKTAAVIAMVLLLGAARNALEKEWRLARTDHLTGALNRQAFFEVVAARASSPCWSVLIYVDLDGLKHVNDTMGHKHGDGSIVAFARRVQSAIRTEDLFARMGGDEFVILMNVRDEQSGISVAERLNRHLNIDAYHIEGRQLLSSCGVLIVPPGPRAIDVELKAADLLMYEAKRLRIGILVATADLTGQAISLSRHVAKTPPAHRSTAIRTYRRDLDTRIQTAVAPLRRETQTPENAIPISSERLTASGSRR